MRGVFLTLTGIAPAGGLPFRTGAKARCQDPSVILADCGRRALRLGGFIASEAWVWERRGRADSAATIRLHGLCSCRRKTEPG